MKTFKFKLILSIVFLILLSESASSQWIMGGIFPDRYTITDNAPALFNVEAVGIGAFTTSPLSALHVNTNLLSTTPVFLPGEVFRTDCPNANNTFWRLYRGGTEFGTLFNNSGSNDFEIQSPAGFLLLNSTGNFVGVGTTTPAFHLTIDNDGGILAMGTFGIGAIVPAGLTATRMIWYPYKAAFRAGDAGAGEWDDANTGSWSAAFGESTTASGRWSFAVGSGTVASGDGATAIGTNTTASGLNSFAMGFTSTVASGKFSFAGGASVLASNAGDFAFGETALATGGFSTCFGLDAQANGQLSYAFGTLIRSNGANSYLLGAGIPAAYFVNAIPNSLMVGFQSDVPTFYVGTAGGTVGSLGNVGIGTSTPANRCEINSAAANTSGLTFTQLTSASPTTVNPGLGILAVGTAGEVIYVPASIASTITGANNGTSLNVAGTTVQFGNDVGFTTAQLLNDREVPMNNRNIFFTDPAVPTAGNNRIQTGFYAGIAYNLFSKFSSFCGENSGFPFRIGGYFTSTSNFNLTGIPAQYSPVNFGTSGFNYKFGTVSIAQDNTGSNARFIGVSGAAYSTASPINVGTSGKAYGSAIENVGINGLAASSGFNASNYGVFGVANGTGTNYGGNFSANSGVTNYGIYASSLPGSGGAGPNYAGYFNGDVIFTAYFGPSDINLKENIDSITNAMNIINQLKPKTFDFKTSAYPQMGLNTRKQYGFIAQEVETILPELVGEAVQPAVLDSLGNITTPALTYKILNYQAFAAILMKGMQEQQKNLNIKDSVINSLESNDSIQDYRLTLLENEVNECCNNRSMQANNNSSSIDVSLKDAQSVVLEQNLPNPFSEQTVIGYFLAADVKKAQMLFYNVQGKLIQSVDLNERGKCNLNVFAQDLSNGIYTYTLIVDDKIFETKKMVKQK